ncbi:MAG: serine hydrolase [Bacteroidia bacterium]|nr:serine hydrolase [Bacteroidia bacterium]
MIKRRATLHLIVLFVVCGTVTSQPLPELLRSELQRVLDSMRIAHGIPGISAGLLLPGHEMWQGTSGGSHPGLPVSPAMLFGIGSNSKLFTAAAVLKCVESGLLTLEDSLHSRLPAFKHIDANITIRQLLNHTSGLADINEITGYPDTILKNPERVFTREEVLSWIGPPHFPAGTSWGYCNTNYLLAGMIVERATGRPFSRFLRDSILTPLQLDSTFLPIDEALDGIIAHPWANGGNVNATSRNSLLSAAWTAGAMYSTSSEMLQWYAALLSGKVLGSTSLREMTTFVGSGNYGFGIAEKILNRRVVWQHGGSIRGYSSQMMYDVSSGAVICVLTNATPAPAALVALQLHAALAETISTTTESVADRGFVMTIHPNPAVNIIHIGHIDGFFSISDILGRMRYSGFANGNIRLDVSDWPDGIYLLRGSAGTRRFLKL